MGSLYDAQFREYGIQGRWPSPDPAGVAAANPANPQSWNRYAYVLNNPLSMTDPTGLQQGLRPMYECGGDGFGCNTTNGASGGGQTCTLNGVETYCSIVEGVLSADAGVDLSGVELDFSSEDSKTPTVIVPVGAYDPYNSTNPELDFSADGNIYVDNDQFAGTYFYDSFLALSELQQTNYFNNLQTIQDNAAASSARISQAVVKGVQSTTPLTNPSFVPCFYAASAAAGLVGGIGFDGEAASTLQTAAAPYAPQLTRFLYSQSGRAPFFFLALAEKAGNAVRNACVGR